MLTMTLGIIAFRRWVPRLLAVGAVIGLLAAATGCGDRPDAPDLAASGGDEAMSVRLGVFPNVTHAPGLVGIDQGLFQEALGPDIELEVRHFNAGGEAVQAMLAGALDLTFIGPNPAINGFAQSGGEAVRLVAGSTSGGAYFVVREGIDSPGDLAGATLASPQPIGNTQDVALRAWLADQGIDADGGNRPGVEIRSMANADVLQAFQQGQLDGAWMPEPWATRLITEGGGHVLVDERDLWPDGRYVTTHVLASTRFLERNPGLVRRFLQGHLAALDLVNDDPARAQEMVLDAIEEVTSVRLDAGVIGAAWENLDFTVDPVASSLAESARDAESAGLLEPVDLEGIYDLTIVNELLAARGEGGVAGL